MRKETVKVNNKEIAVKTFKGQKAVMFKDVIWYTGGRDSRQEFL